jgi:uncharacterized protein YndB with AHSA1/START domain
MISFSNRVAIAADPSEVFAYISDPIHIPEWNYYVEQVTPLDGSEARPGSRYHQRRRTDQQVFELAEFQPPTRVVMRTLPGQPPLIQQMARPTIRHAVRDNLGKLVELVETGTTTLQDGRVSARARPAPARRP